MGKRALSGAIVFLFVSATIFSLAGRAKAVEILGCYPPEGIYGYVKNNNNQPIYQALVKVFGNNLYTDKNG